MAATRNAVYYTTITSIGGGTKDWVFRLAFIPENVGGPTLDLTDMTIWKALPAQDKIFTDLGSFFDASYDTLPLGMQNSTQVGLKMNLAPLEETEDWRAFREYLTTPHTTVQNVVWYTSKKSVHSTDNINTGNTWILFTDEGSGSTFNPTTWRRMFEGVQRWRSEDTITGDAIGSFLEYDLTIDEMMRWCLEQLSPETVSKYIYYNFVDWTNTVDLGPKHFQNPAACSFNGWLIVDPDGLNTADTWLAPYCSTTSQHSYAYDYLFMYNYRNRGANGDTVDNDAADAEAITAYAFQEFHELEADRVDMRFVNLQDYFFVMEKLMNQIRVRQWRQPLTGPSTNAMRVKFAPWSGSGFCGPFFHSYVYEQYYEVVSYLSGTDNAIKVSPGDSVSLAATPSVGTDYADGVWMKAFVGKVHEWETFRYFNFIDSDLNIDTADWHNKCIDGFLCDGNGTSLFKHKSMWEYLREECKARLCKAKVSYEVVSAGTFQAKLKFGGVYEEETVRELPPISSFSESPSVTRQSGALAQVETDIEQAGRDEYKVQYRSQGVPPEGHYSIPISLHSTPTSGAVLSRITTDLGASSGEINNHNFDRHCVHLALPTDIDQLFYMREGTDGPAGVSSARMTEGYQPIRLHSYVKIGAILGTGTTHEVDAETDFTFIPARTLDTVIKPPASLRYSVQDVGNDLTAICLPEQRRSGWGYYSAKWCALRFSSRLQARTKVTLPLEHVFPPHALGNYLRPVCAPPLGAGILTDFGDYRMDGPTYLSEFIIEGFVTKIKANLEDGSCDVEYLYAEQTA